MQSAPNDCPVMLDAETVCGDDPVQTVVLFDKALGMRVEVIVCSTHGAQHDRASAALRTRRRPAART